MIPDIDTWRAAMVMRRRYGGEAALEAAQRADEFLAAGNLAGQAVWKRIRAAIIDLERATRHSGEPIQ